MPEATTKRSNKLAELLVGENGMLAVLILLGQWWIASPYDRLVKQIDRVANRRHVTDLSALPLAAEGSSTLHT